MDTRQAAGRRRRSQGGFGTMEALVASVLSLLVALAIMSFFDAQQRAYATLSTYSESQNVTRTAIDLMSRELRMASYDSLGTALTLSPGPTCPSVREGVVVAMPSYLQIKQDLDNSGAIDAANENVIYAQTGNRLVRTDVVQNQALTLVEGVPSNGFNLRYYAGTPSVEQVPAGTPAQLNQGQRACVDKISIEIDSQIADPYPGKPAVHSSVRSTVAIRNRAIITF